MLVILSKPEQRATNLSFEVSAFQTSSQQYAKSSSQVQQPVESEEDRPGDLRHPHRPPKIHIAITSQVQCQHLMASILKVSQPLARVSWNVKPKWVECSPRAKHIVSLRVLSSLLKQVEICAIMSLALYSDKQYKAFKERRLLLL